MSGAVACEKDVIIFSYFIDRWDDFTTCRTNTTSLFENFGQVTSPSLIDTVYVIERKQVCLEKIRIREIFMDCLPDHAVAGILLCKTKKHFVVNYTLV